MRGRRGWGGGWERGGIAVGRGGDVRLSSPCFASHQKGTLGFYFTFTFPFPPRPPSSWFHPRATCPTRGFSLYPLPLFPLLFGSGFSVPPLHTQHTNTHDPRHGCRLLLSETCEAVFTRWGREGVQGRGFTFSPPDVFSGSLSLALRATYSCKPDACFSTGHGTAMKTVLNKPTNQQPPSPNHPSIESPTKERNAMSHETPPPLRIPLGSARQKLVVCSLSVGQHTSNAHIVVIIVTDRCNTTLRPEAGVVGVEGVVGPRESA